MYACRFGLWLIAVMGVQLIGNAVRAADPWIVLDGREGPGKGKHVVLVSGDEEYRSEETLPQLAQILANHHGFKCTILFAIDPKDGTVNPNVRDNIPGLEALETADLMVIFTRFRELPDEQMKHIVQYLESGRPIIGLRTATHAFAFKKEATYARYSWDSKDWDGGFGRQVLGETWISHHGQHGKQSTRGIIAPGADRHPILRGIHDGDIWGPTDVYGVRLPLAHGIQPLVLGQVLQGMKATDEPVPGTPNNPMMPIAWVKASGVSNDSGSSSEKAQPGRSHAPIARVFTTTMGASQDFQSEGLRRLLVNACYWTVGLENQIRARTRVDIVGEFHPHPFGFGGFEKGRKPSDFASR